MAQGFQGVAEADAAPTSVGTTETGQVTLVASSSGLAEDNSAKRQAPLPQRAGPSADALDPAVPEETACQNAAVFLDEANDLLVINEAGALLPSAPLLPSAQSDWTDSLVAQSGLLSESSASWAQEILAAEAESAGVESLEAPPLSEDAIAGPGDEAAALPRGDWIDW